MVRVAPVGQPHRATKRDYDYFEELNAKLAARCCRLTGRAVATEHVLDAPLTLGLRYPVEPRSSNQSP